MTAFLAEADRRLSHLTEDIARRMSRRQAIVTGLKGVVTTAAAFTVGAATNVTDAFAVSCGCSYPGCGNCSCRGKSCPTSGCPSGCYVCKSTDCPNSSCIYSSGYWVDSDCPCGRCGYGYYLCYDCRCTSCSYKCGCRSICLCSGCCAPADVRAHLAEMAAAN